MNFPWVRFYECDTPVRTTGKTPARLPGQRIRPAAGPVLLFLQSVFFVQVITAGPEPFAIGGAEHVSWVDSTLAALSIEQKVGQLFVVELTTTYSHREGQAYRYALEMIKRYHVGGFLLAGGGLLDVPYTANQLQRESAVPLLINADLESGLTQYHPWHWSRGWTERLPRTMTGGGTGFPSMMAFGAAGDTSLAYEAGFILAQEARAVGIHWTNSPVADVNVNPRNPVINTRSFGEDPALVAAMVGAYVRGVQNGGVLATLKHFPGHGETSLDSHMGLPVLDFTRARLDSVELVPFRAGISAGARAVMTAHIAVPVIDPERRPSTLSPPVLTGLLRGRLGFQGIIITDGMRMQGITDGYGAAGAAVLALEAGADVVLGPEDIDTAFNVVVGAVKSGRISRDRLDTSVRRILAAKAWVGLHREREVPLDPIRALVASPAHLAVAERVADASVTLLENNGTLLPIAPHSQVRVVTVTEAPWPEAGEEMSLVFGDLGYQVQRIQVHGETGAERLREIAARIDSPGVTVMGVYLSIGAWKGELRLPESLDRFLARSLRGERVAVVAFGDPYILGRLPAAPVVVAAYSGIGSSERAVARALAGVVPWKGTLPVTIPGRYARGSGIRQGGAEAPRQTPHVR